MGDSGIHFNVGARVQSMRVTHIIHHWARGCTFYKDNRDVSLFKNTFH